MGDQQEASKTDLAEDRTLLASERTFAGWMRTSLGCVGIAVAFQALFGEVRPAWVPRLIASLFLALSIVIAVAAERRGAAMRNRLSPHVAKAADPINLRLIAAIVSVGALGLGLTFWFLPVG
ncbi:DUF202 domain-containing protein [Sphingomonas sp. LHG3406-1]|uniref:YidH family protein n=1 Tax=Sphingomonas sp. LHG3406-1 TaxID=2804617 RepID=UPI0026347C29|nr:DUF202 domain-containing protein [Sphingomonas sp. LHG3406-1]